MISKFYSGIEVKCNEEDLNKKSVIYCLTFENGKTYIGQTTQKLQDRIHRHCHFSNGCTKLKNAIQKYKSFTVSILSSNLDINQLNLFEKIFIKLLNSNGNDGYNLDSGGKNKNRSDETKKRLSEINMGKKHSDETKRKMSESHKNISDDTKLKMSKSQKGRKHTAETKSKIGNSGKCKHSKKIKSIPDDIIFNSVEECAKYYHIVKLQDYYNGKIHKKSGQTFVIISK